MSSLIIISGESKGETFELPADKDTVIGRVSSCDFSIFDTRMSRRHCIITPGNDGPVIKDMGSSNGVTINGKKLAEAVLHDGDRIVLGATELDFFIADAMPDAETEVLPSAQDMAAAVDAQAPDSAPADEKPAKPASEEKEDKPEPQSEPEPEPEPEPELAAKKPSADQATPEKSAAEVELDVPSSQTKMSDVLDPVPAPAAAQQALVEEEPEEIVDEPEEVVELAEDAEEIVEPEEIIDIADAPEEIIDSEPGEKQPD
jgi:predicted component of type VI protein secretion system